MGRSVVLEAVLLATGLLYGMPARAQTEIGVDVDLSSSYIWRGLSMTNKPVVKPAGYVGIPAGAASILLGGWANIDLGKYDDPGDDIAQSGGSSAFNLAEFDPYAEVSVPLGKTTLTGGIIGYIYPNDDNAPNQLGFMTSDANTVEVYGKLGVDVPLSPELSIYYDVDKIKGAYLEGSLSYSLAASESISIELGAAAGFSAGQGDTSDDLDEASRFDDDGFTHLDLSAGAPFNTGDVSITPVVHLLVNADERTKVTSPAHFDKDLKVWAGFSVGWSNSVGQESGDSDEAQ
jgi:hypothetical protein